MHQLIAIAIGGSVGAIMRFLTANGIYALLGRSFPHGTLFVNVAGSLLMGFLTELMVNRFALAAEYRAAILVGFLGAFTTFSTFALETMYLFEEGNLLKAFLNIFLSVILCVTACWIGLIWGRTFFSEALPLNGLQELPGLKFALNLFAAFIVSLFAELLLNLFGLNTEIRAIFFIGLLSAVSISLTLWLGFTNSTLQVEFHHLLSIFILNTALGAIMVWSGSWIGNWLWQLKPSL